MQKIEPTAGGLTLQVNGDNHFFDACLATTSPGLLSKLAPDLPADYLGQLLELKSMGAVVLTLALSNPFMPDEMTYWLNIPANTPDKSESEYPFWR
ncbi:MAG: hypothetical protein HC804_13000 [Anaerolineae bacterium]|nr:hypothetical protein [Anaerolineae bacterium]